MKVLIFLIFLFLFGCVQSINSEKELALVERVIDGDTLELASGERVRLIGINSPERQRICSIEATNFLREKVEGKTVELEKEKTDLDLFGRKLRNLFVEESNVNVQLVREGFATIYEFESGLKYLNELRIAENFARENGNCLWKKAKMQCIEIKQFNFDAEGNDNVNLNDEFIEFENNCGFDVSLNGWSLKDAGTNIFEFSEIVFEKNSSVVLFSGKGIDSGSSLYWNNQAVWNNSGDRVFLRNEFGELVLFFEYGG